METYSTLLLQAQNMTADPTSTTTTSLSTSPAFLTTEINNSIRDIFRLIRKYNLRPLPKTAVTVANQIWYHMPPGLSKIETVTSQSGTWTSPPLKIIQTQEEWDLLHQTPVAATLFPIAIFPRRDDFGIYPTPQASGYTITIVGNYLPVAMTTPDYTAGSVTVTNNSTTLTGSGTTFTAAMVGRWFCLTDGNGIADGNWFRVASYTSATVLTLETFYQGTTTAGASYLIGQSPDMPEELQEFIPYRAAANYFMHRRRDDAQAQKLLNYYYTGDYDNANRTGKIRGGILYTLQELNEKGRGNSQMAQMGGIPISNRLTLDLFATTLTAPA